MFLGSHWGLSLGQWPAYVLCSGWSLCPGQWLVLMFWLAPGVFYVLGSLGSHMSWAVAGAHVHMVVRAAAGIYVLGSGCELCLQQWLGADVLSRGCGVSWAVEEAYVLAIRPSHSMS